MKFPSFLSLILSRLPGCLVAVLACLAVGLAPSTARAADVSITAASVIPSADAIYLESFYGGKLIADEAITAGQLVYLDADDSWSVNLSDCNSGTAGVRDVDGIAVNNAGAGQSVSVVAYDPALTLGGTTANGTIYVLSATAGGIAPAADVTTGWYVAVVGVGLPSNKIFFSCGKGPNEMRTTTAQ